MDKKVYNNFADEWASRLKRGKNLPHDYIAKPALYELIGDIKGKTILSIGCGSGEECSYFMSQGAKRVVGIDTSDKLIAIAKKQFPSGEFYTMDMENISLVDTFDIVVSNLVMHYVPTWNKTLKEIKKILHPEGRVIISTNHPIRFGAEIKREETREIFLLGYIRYKDHSAIGDVLGDYLSEREVHDMWFGKFNISYFNRPLEAIFRDIREENFIITNYLEPKPAKWVEKENPSFYHIHTKIPLFIFLELKNK